MKATPKLDQYAPAVIGKSLAGFTLGDELDNFIPLVDTILKRSETDRQINEIIHSNQGVLLFVQDDWYDIFFSQPRIELCFSKKGKLWHIIVSDGYKGEIFDGLKIGDRLADIKHPLYFDDPDEVHYLIDDGHVISGIWFYTGEGELEEDPDQRILEVRVYDYSIE